MANEFPAPQRLLVRGVNWLGDAVMTTPALERLREHLPQTEITLLTPRKLADLWRQHPSLDKFVLSEPGESPWSVAQRLRARGFDTALVLPNSHRAALEVWLAGIPRRVGGTTPWRNWLLSQAVPSRPEQVRMGKRSARQVRALIRPGAQARRNEPKDPLVHQIFDHLHLASAFGASRAPTPPRLAVLPDEIAAAEKDALARLSTAPAGQGSGSPFWFGLNPAAAYGPAKCWPAERFAAVVRQVCQAEPRARWLLFAENPDCSACRLIAEQSAAWCVNLAGQTSLRQLMAALKVCRVVLTNDSGPMHVAAALGTPVVVPFGSTSPELTGPGLPGAPEHHLLRADVPCAPCFRRTCPLDLRCLTGISVESVAAAVLTAVHH